MEAEMSSKILENCSLSFYVILLRNIEDIDLESQTKKLQETKEVIDHLESQVDSYHTQSEQQLTDVNSLFEKTKSSGEVCCTDFHKYGRYGIFQNAEDILNQAIEFNSQIENMIDDVEAAIKQGSNEEEQAAIKAKREEVNLWNEMNPSEILYFPSLLVRQKNNTYFKGNASRS